MTRRTTMQGTSPWDRKYSPPASAKRLADHHDLTEREREVASKAVGRMVEYRLWYVEAATHKQDWNGETASELVKRLLPDASARRHYHVLTVACRLATERGLDMTSRKRASDYREDAA